MQAASSTINTATPASRFGDTADLIARITLALLFVFSGADKLFFHTAGAVEYMQAVGLPLSMDGSIGPAAMLSRAVGGLAGRTVVLTMPGSPAAVRLAVERLIAPELPHLVREARR